MNLRTAEIAASSIPIDATRSLAVSIRMVRTGGWVTVLPFGAVYRAVEAGDLIARPVVEPTLERRLSIVRRHGEPLEEGAAAFVDILAAWFEVNRLTVPVSSG